MTTTPLPMDGDTPKTDPSAGPPGTLPAIEAESPLACPYRQTALLQQALASDKMRVGFFLGAGCPVSIRVPNGVSTGPLIPNIEGLTENIRLKMASSQEYNSIYSTIFDLSEAGESGKRTIEHVLTKIRSLVDAIGSKNFEGFSKKQLMDLDKELCREITAVMEKRLLSNATPYHQLASWINAIPRAHAVEIFTSNYDLLMEQALEECRVPYFDGFCGSDRTFFDSTSMEQDKLPSRWARLWKVHGSINRWRSAKDEIQRKSKGEEGELQMIHPSHLKYLQSRMMPYLAMQDRLRAFLSRGQAVLVTCGYSFADGHLTRAILEGLRGNPTAVCFGLIFEDKEQAERSIAQAGTPGNLRLLGVNGGVLGTISRNWHSNQKPDDNFHGLAVNIGNLGDRTIAPDERCKFLLGDFKSFGQFLASELERRDHEVEDNDGK